jgi:hypothetical protein
LTQRAAAASSGVGTSKMSSSWTCACEIIWDTWVRAQ